MDLNGWKNLIQEEINRGHNDINVIEKKILRMERRRNKLLWYYSHSLCPDGYDGLYEVKSKIQNYQNRLVHSKNDIHYINKRIDAKKDSIQFWNNYTG